MSGQTYEQLRQERVAAAKAEGDRYRELSVQQDREVNENWWVIESPEVEKAVRQATKRIAATYGELFDVEDLEAEAWIAASRIAKRAQECLEGLDGATMGTFQHELEMDLLDLLRPIAGRHSKTSSGFEPETGEPITTSLTDISHGFRGGSGVEWSEDLAAVG